jgi:signal transduction histidine kinase
MADPLLLRRVVDNLVDNALRYAPRGTAVRLGAYRESSGWNFEVADQGPGVPVEYREHLFERFARPDADRNPGARGAGLGLALSAAIAKVHRGDLRLSEPGPGAVFQLHLPADGRS